jgi:hypothetical protein
MEAELQTRLAYSGQFSSAWRYAGLVAWYLLRDWQWFLGSAVLLANWPFTLVVIMPVNKKLLAMQPYDAGDDSRKLLLQWGGLHNVRSALRAASALLFVWGILFR